MLTRGNFLIKFKSYKRNPIEFFERVEENLLRNRKKRWTVIRRMLDEMFKDTHDNWWTATRHDIQSYPEFKKQFKAKYWSEATQNIVRDDLCHGRYEPYTGQTPSAYFLGKVCLARNLEPRIPDECLVTKLALHYRKEIKQARLCGQIKSCLLYTSRCV